jgi:hypothetical protein
MTSFVADDMMHSYPPPSRSVRRRLGIDDYIQIAFIASHPGFRAVSPIPTVGRTDEQTDRLTAAD